MFFIKAIMTMLTFAGTVIGAIEGGKKIKNFFNKNESKDDFNIPEDEFLNIE